MHSLDADRTKDACFPLMSLAAHLGPWTHSQGMGYKLLFLTGLKVGVFLF